MARFTSISFFAIAVYIQHASSTFSESIDGYNTIGDHFGYPSFTNATYDYVVIGGGTAGLAIATKLAMGGAGTVAVIENGGFYEMDNGNLSSVPGTAAYFIGTAPFFKNPQIDWEYQTEPNPGLGGRSILYNSGKTLGGGSARNYMVYARPTEGALQKWADDVGDTSYTLENFLPFYKSSVTLGYPNNFVRDLNASIYPAPLNYGTHGLLKVSFSNHANAWGSWAKLALKTLGLAELPDFVSGNLLGYQYASQTIEGLRQTRSSSETSYLRAAMNDDSQLQVYKTSLAKKILFDSTNKATGVMVNTAGVDYALFASKEVILSAGVHRSPQLLMVSGVGPKDTLESLGIPVISNLPGVGQNLQDQPFFGPSFPVALQTHSAVLQPAFQVAQIAEYRKQRTGYLTNPGSDFLAWEKIPSDLLETLSNATQAALATLPADWPVFQHTFADAFYGTGYDMLVGAPTDGRNYVSILPTLVATFSRGNVTIKSTDTSVNPVINSNLLGDVRDQEIAVAAVKRARQIFNSTTLNGIKVGPEAYPGTNVASNADILKYVMNTASPIWHASSTCKMGSSNDSLVVLDSKAKVRGVAGLRVVDASAFPFNVPVHPQGTVYALAEKIAHDILSPSS